MLYVFARFVYMQDPLDEEEPRPQGERERRVSPNGTL